MLNWGTYSGAYGEKEAMEMRAWVKKNQQI